MLNKNILILGASGMLGSAVLRLFSESTDNAVTGSVQSKNSIRLLPEKIRNFVIAGIDVKEADLLTKLLDQVQPDIVINCVGLVKQLSDVNDPLVALPINSLFPHRLAQMCASVNARLIHISTDCVFTGKKGMYSEDDVTDAQDLYGVSKRLGEVDYPNAITLRTSIIGHELEGHRSLISWFLNQKGAVKGFKQAIFSGLPTIEIARIIRDYVIPNPDLTGVYHVSSEPISKYDLLCLVADIYQKDIKIIEDHQYKIDRSLNSTKFRNATGFKPDVWPDMIKSMRDFN
tara:strand:+ start:217 stop:1080 length:864 start_codon:yes stop_codon:yes gene_type:complete